jgi:cytidylate kinase
MKPDQPFIIAVDGYSSCGKSTFARMIAKELNFTYIDSGAMYRAVALFCLEQNMFQDNEVIPEMLNTSLHRISIEFRTNSENGMQETWLNGKNVEQEIRGIAVSSVVSKISQIKAVRQKMVTLQREIACGVSVVMDGRDIGSTVFPLATLKIFMTADVQIRAIRRYNELFVKAIDVSLQEVIENIRMRDHEDETRVESPLRKAEDAVILDNSHMTLSEQMEWFRQIWALKRNSYAN